MMTPPPTTHERLSTLLRSLAEQTRAQFGDLPVPESRELLIDRVLAGVAAAAGLAFSLRRRSRDNEAMAGAWLSTAVRLWMHNRPDADVIKMPDKRA